MSDWLVAIVLNTAAYERLREDGLNAYRPLCRVRRMVRNRRVYVAYPGGVGSA
jgi:hypothetical protein